MQTPLILRTYRESDAFFYDLLIFLLKSTENIVRSDDGDSNGKLKVPEGVWKIPFEFTIPKYAYESYNGKNVSIINNLRNNIHSRYSMGKRCKWENVL